MFDHSLIAVNLGDSRIIASYQKGQVTKQLTRDHEPVDLQECMRIFNNGGSIYKENLSSK